MAKILLILLGVMSCSISMGQLVEPKVYAASGGHYTGTNLQLSFTIGEPVIETVSNTNNIITQGFHQSNYDVTSIEKNSDLGYEISVFPNPVSDILQVHITSTVTRSALRIELVDITGKILINQKIARTTDVHQVNLNEYARGSYFLRITNEKEQLISSYKIQKL